MDNGGNMLHKTMCEIIIDGESTNNAGGGHNVLKQWPENFQSLSARSHLIVVPMNGSLEKKSKNKAKGSIIGYSAPILNL
jgi:hypothetical protein